MSYSIIYQTHKISVMLFLLIYLVKTILLLSNKNELLQKITKVVKVPEMIISFLFLLTGIYMLTQVPEIKPIMIVKIVVVFSSIPIAVIGFKKQNKMLASLSLVMIIAAYGMAEMAKKSGVPKVESAVVDGVQLYNTYCVTCHGSDGKLGASGAKDLSATQMDHASIVAIITNGKNNMVPMKNTLNIEQIEAVALYVETLKK